jgi:hypothetical protein
MLVIGFGLHGIADFDAGSPAAAPCSRCQRGAARCCVGHSVAGDHDAGHVLVEVGEEVETRGVVVGGDRRHRVLAGVRPGRRAVEPCGACHALKL